MLEFIVVGDSIKSIASDLGEGKTSLGGTLGAFCFTSSNGTWAILVECFLNFKSKRTLNES